MRQGLLQRSFDHVIKQGKPSMNHNRGVCRYKNEEGLSCAAAIFITKYDEDMEGSSWEELARFIPDLLEEGAVKESNFVYKVIQRPHDIASRHTDFIPAYKRALVNAIDEWNFKHQDNIRPPEGF